MPKFVKRPVVVEAFRTKQRLVIKTLEGEMTAEVGDFVITGVNGEIYPCKPDIFYKTYDYDDEAARKIMRELEKEVC